MNTVYAGSATEAWDMWYEIFERQAISGKKIPSRVGPIVGECLNAVTTITNPRKSLCQSTIRKASIDYSIGELLWYLSGSNKLTDIAPYSKAWERLSDDGEVVNSAYGYRIRYGFGFDQWQFCVDTLRNDPYSRQAVIHIKDPSNKPSKDVPCTLNLQYSIRDGKLYATTMMRSNDLWLGVPYDYFVFMSLQTKMAMELGVELGTYTHFASSLHMYERDWQRVAGKDN